MIEIPADYLVAYFVEAIEYGMNKIYPDCSFAIGERLVYPLPPDAPEHLQSPSGLAYVGMYLGRQQFAGVMYFIIAYGCPHTHSGKFEPMGMFAYMERPELCSRWRSGTITAAERSKTRFKPSEPVVHSNEPPKLENLTLPRIGGYKEALCISCSHCKTGFKHLPTGKCTYCGREDGFAVNEDAGER